MAEVLPRLDLIGLRERRESARLLDAIGVRPERVIVTGDDAIEMASVAHRAEIGGAIGVNVRVAGYAGVTASAVDAIRPAVRCAAKRLGCTAGRGADRPSQRLPRRRGDPATLLAGSADAPAPIVDLDTPAKAIAEVSRCRVVVTGSYHAAVFALAQGIPVVAIAATRYYLDKFAGLAELFGGGCTIVAIALA